MVDGFPPIARGSTQPGRDNELRLIRQFPEAAFLIEKPVSIASLAEVEQVREALRGRVVSVGYMLRYLEGESGSPGGLQVFRAERGSAAREIKSAPSSSG